MELIIFIVIISYIVKAVKQSSDGQANGTKKNNTYQQAVRENIAKVRERAQMNPREIYEQMHMSDYSSKQMQQPTRQEVQAQIERTKQRIMTSRGMTSATSSTSRNEHFQQADMHRQQENREAKRQVQASRMEARNTTILQRAQANAEEDKVDVTLQTMEAEHNHSERVSTAEHHHPEDVMPESMLGSIEDLMIKGYEGNLCFERDFVGEAMDMVSRFYVISIFNCL